MRRLSRKRLEKMVKQRPRTDNENRFEVGDQIDFHVDSLQKGLSGWKGPVEIEKIKDGMVSFKWQGDQREVQIRKIKLHVPLLGFLQQYGRIF